MTTSALTFHVKVGDTLPVIRERLYDADGVEIPLTNATVRFHLIKGTVILDKAATVSDIPTALVQYAWAPGDLDIPPGMYTREWQCTLASGKVVTVPNDRLGYPVEVSKQIA